MLAVATLALFVVSLGYGVIVPLLPELAGGRGGWPEAPRQVYDACKDGRTKMVETLLKNGADPNQGDERYNCVMITARWGDEETIKVSNV